MELWHTHSTYENESSMQSSAEIKLNAFPERTPRRNGRTVQSRPEHFDDCRDGATRSLRADVD